MGNLEILSFHWWQVILIFVTILVSPLIKAIATVIVGKFVNPEIAKLALPLIFQRRVNNIKIGKIEKPSERD